MNKNNFNHDMFSKNLNDAYFEIIEQKRMDSDVRCRTGTNINDETVKVYLIKKNKIIKILTFKDGKKYYKTIGGK